MFKSALATALSAGLLFALCAVSLAAAPAPVADDHPNTLAGPFTAADQVTPGGAAVSGTLETARDTDIFQVALTAGSAYTFTVPLGTLSDSVLTLVNPSGWAVAYNDDDPTGTLGRGSRIANYIAPKTGTYYLVVRAWSRWMTGTYTVQASAPAAVVDLAVTAIGLTPSSPDTSTAVTASFSIKNLGTATAPAFGYDVRVDGTSLGTRRAAAGLAASATLTDTAVLGTLAAGVHYVAVSADTGGETGDINKRNNTAYSSFRVVAPGLADDHPNSLRGPFGSGDQVAVGGAAVPGNIERRGDVDVLQVPLTASSSVTFEVALGTLLDSVLWLVDPNGWTVGFNDDDPTKVLGLGSRISGFIPKTTGTYYLVVRSYSYRGTGTYTVKAHQ